MKVLTIGDPHFKISNVNETDIMCDEIIKICIERKPDLIVILGDILDRHELIHVNPLSRAIDFFKRLLELNIELFVLIGNHDLKNNKQYLSNEHPFTSLKLLNKLTIVDIPITKIINNLKLTFVPYVPPGKFIEALDTLSDWKSSTCIFAHQEFKGVHMGCIISTEGDIWENNNPLVISGHIHGYCKLQSNIIYVGTPIQHNFGDSIDKSISLFTIESEIKEERIYLDFIKKYTYNINFKDINNFNPLIGNNKIIISGTLSEIKSLDKNKKINEWKKLNYKIFFKNNNIIDNDNDNNIKPKEKFSTLLFNSIKHDNNLIELFNKLMI